MNARIWWISAGMMLAVTVVSATGAETNVASPASAPESIAVSGPTATNPPPVTVVRPPEFKLPPLLDQVVRMSERGTEESVIRAYIESAPPYQITGNDILQLQDLGISKEITLALIERSKATAVSDASSGPVAPAAEQTAAEPAPAVTPSATPPDEYYDSLAPYGSWMSVPGYGRCWQPTVVAVNPGWRPYCDYGDWLWSDCGWYWNSYYSWGWAPFHYGRWFCHPSSGWLWCPDRVWGPAWVCWRNSSSFCGWAPLPPGACFFPGVGFTFHGAHVGVDFGFGLGFGSFTFVDHHHFADQHVGRFAVGHNQANTVFHHTAVVNNVGVGPHNTIFNRGVGRETIAAASQTPIRQVSGVDLTRRGRDGLGTSIHRTTPATSISRFNAPVNSGATRSFAQSPAPRGAAPSVNNHQFGGSGQSTPRSAQPNPRVTSVSRSAPAVSHAAPSFAMPRSTPAPTFSAPRQSFPAAPSYATPRMSPSFGHSSPAFGSAGHGGSWSGGGRSMGGVGSMGGGQSHGGHSSGGGSGHH